MNVATLSIAYLENTGLERNYADRKKNSQIDFGTSWKEFTKSTLNSFSRIELTLRKHKRTTNKMKSGRIFYGRRAPRELDEIEKRKQQRFWHEKSW